MIDYGRFDKLLNTKPSYEKMFLSCTDLIQRFIVVQVPDFITLEAYSIDFPEKTKEFPYGDAYYLRVDWLYGQWCPFKLPESAWFNRSTLFSSNCQNLTKR